MIVKKTIEVEEMTYARAKAKASLERMPIGQWLDNVISRAAMHDTEDPFAEEPNPALLQALKGVK